MNVDDFWPRRSPEERHRALRQRLADDLATELVTEALTPEHRLTVEELRTALAHVRGEAWVVSYDPGLDRRLWVARAHYDGHFELTGVRR